MRSGGVDLELGLEIVDELTPLVPADATIAQFALRWILDFAEGSTVIPGARTPAQAKANALAAALQPLPAETTRTISELYRNRIAGRVHQRW